jgi:hypothetical protein
MSWTWRRSTNRTQHIETEESNDNDDDMDPFDMIMRDMEIMRKNCTNIYITFNAEDVSSSTVAIQTFQTLVYDGIKDREVTFIRLN